MARKYARDKAGRFASTGSTGRRPAAKAAPRGKNLLTRDNSGKITSKGGSGATARGGRLKTSSGKLRAVQTAKIKGGPGKFRTGKSAAPAKVAAKSSTAPKKKKGRIDDDKISRVVTRVNSVTRGAGAKSGVKALNATEVGVRAKSFLARKAGSVGMLNQQSQPAAFASVKKALTKPPRYSTQTPNRNKPRKYNDLGQDKVRAKAQEAAMTARERIARSNTPSKPKRSSPVRGLGRRELIGSGSKGKGTIRVVPVASTMRKPKGAKPAPNSLVARTRKQSKAAQRNRREQILDRGRTGSVGFGIMKKNPRIKRVDTGMRQLSLAGPAKPLYRYKRQKRR